MIVFAIYLYSWCNLCIPQCCSYSI